MKSYNEIGIKKYKYVATLDSRTSELCRELDGKEFEVSKAQTGVNYPPMHPRCRSTTISVIDKTDYSRLKRSARDENGEIQYVPKSMTYKEWKHKYVDKSAESGIIKSMGLGANSDGSIEKHDVPKLIKTIDPNDREAIRREFAEFEKTVVNEPIEHALVITKDGEVYHCYGVKDRVFVDSDLGDKLSGASVSHNHPIDVTEYSFSDDDVRLFYLSNMNELIGFDEKYEYCLSRTDMEIDKEPKNWDMSENVQHSNVILDIERKYNNCFGYKRRKKL